MYTTSFEELPLTELLVRVQTLKHEGIRFVQLCAEKGSDDALDLLYTFYDEQRDEALNYIVPLAEGDVVPSIQELYFSSFTFENETHDLFGVPFANMKLDFGGHFFNVATDAPMTILSPEQKAARDKAAKLEAAKKAKAVKEAQAAREAVEDSSAERALTTSAAEADAAAVAEVDKLAPRAAKVDAPADPAPAAPAAADASPAADDRAAKMAAKIAAMDPEKAARARAALAAKGIVLPDAADTKEGE
ncbi:NADH-quinone oxidoreductase subunit C [Collinsella vaginalis]|uniref:NADH-quinone oxidoreductase subunit C n=1 Tax=Collinsella vaginalis TaxID=1870987 RepID=UPI000A269798|nr:NADH-quinone oxidoreductase subunit C [Collinsella vaginalis]